MEGIQMALSESLIQNLHSTIDINDISNDRIIVVGDFNFGAKGMVTMEPFANTRIKTKCTLQNPVASCCDESVPSTQDPWHGFRSGDFIFDSKATASPVMPPQYDSDVAQSDHLPVISKLPK